MEIDKVIQDLNKRFAAPLPEFYKRRIIFWYDEDREFEDKLEDIEIANAKLLVLTGTNNFASKKLLNVDDTTSNYLVYSPITYESQEDNWLLNIELYSEEFRADLVSIWMNEIDLPSTLDFRRLIKAYKKFFGAQPRRAAFAKLNKGITTASQMHLAVMAAICGVDVMVGTEVFPCVNECILTQLMTEISNHIINVDVITSTVEKRRTLAWYDDVECYYEGILQVAKMQAFFLEHILPVFIPWRQGMSGRNIPKITTTWIPIIVNIIWHLERV